MCSAQAFLLNDYAKTLFPLKTNRIVVEYGARFIKDYIEEILKKPEADRAFLVQNTVYAAKQNWHLRRTMKLDPVAEYYLYDVIYRNRSKFRASFSEHRTSFGYKFKDGEPITATSSYKAFKAAIAQYSKEYKNFICFDIASYFNSLYHHDIVAWFSNKSVDQSDSEGLGRYLREIAGGRSIDCLPQGLYPAKMIGNDLLSFVDNYFDLRSAKLIRFMDDFYLFDDDHSKILHDFVLIQKLLGEKGLSINPKKTGINETGHLEVDREIDNIKKSLLERRRYVVHDDYEDEEVEIELSEDLDDEELSYIESILERDTIEEEDAELVLSVMRSHTENVMDRLDYIIGRFPNLAKNIYYFSSNVEDKEGLAKIVLDFLASSDIVQEYQLFWLGAMVEDHLMNTERAASLIQALYSHKSATSITKAKVLEIPDQRYGLLELRDSILKTGQSDWLSWAAAVGSRSVPSASRNYKLGYFRNSSPMNKLMYEVVSAL